MSNLPNSNLTEKQIATMAEIAKGVVANYPSLEITEVLNRIHYITGRDYPKCINGLKLMLRHSLISPNFVLNLNRLPALERVTNKIFPLIEAMDASMVSAQEAITPSDGPTEDEEETSEPKALNLSHINSNY